MPKYIPDYPGQKRKMDWWALRRNKCPKCGKDLDLADAGMLIYCSSNRCDFSITPQRMSEIVSTQNQRDVEEKHDDSSL